MSSNHSAAAAATDNKILFVDKKKCSVVTQQKYTAITGGKHPILTKIINQDYLVAYPVMILGKKCQVMTWQNPKTKKHNDGSAKIPRNDYKKSMMTQ